MSLDYRLTPEAQSGIDEIVDLIAEDSVDAGLRVVDAFQKAFQHLAHLPGIGHQQQDLTERPLKFLSVLSYFVAYDPSCLPLTVIAVVHGVRDEDQLIRDI